jgi:hypothetical protein
MVSYLSLGMFLTDVALRNSLYGYSDFTRKEVHHIDSLLSLDKMDSKTSSRKDS